MSLPFRIEQRAGPARLGRMLTAHGEVETPVFMPVGTVANVKGVSQEVLEDLGVEILLGNTYHLYLRPGHEQIRRLGGLHKFMAWNRALLTDSGGFQVWSLSDLRKISEEGVAFRSHLDGSAHFFSPEKAMEIQIALGADIIMAFDECTAYPSAEAEARQSMEMTARWAERCKRYFEQHRQEVPWVASELSLAAKQSSPADCVPGGAANTGSDDEQIRARLRAGLGIPPSSRENASRKSAGEERPQFQSLFGIVQGGMYPHLRQESARRVSEIGFPGYAIGGLSVGEPRQLTCETVQATLEHLPEEKPRYLMGVGTPEEIVEYAALGVDMLDCVMPTRAARHGLLYTSLGKISIKTARYALDEGPLDPNCCCAVCRRYSRAYLRHLYASNEVLAQVLNTMHNLAFYLDTMRAVRQAIKLGEFSRFHSGVRSRSLNSPAQA